LRKGEQGKAAGPRGAMEFYEEDFQF